MAVCTTALGGNMGLVTCGNCGQSVNPKRDVCPFCGAAVEKSPRFTLPSRKAAAQAQPVAEASAIAQAEAQLKGEPSAIHSSAGSPTVSAQKPSEPAWWRRPKLIIPVVAALAVVVVVGVVLVHNASVNNANKKAAEAALLPFQRLQSKVKIFNVSIDDMKTAVQDAQFAFDSYKPLDARGKVVAKHLRNALLTYTATLLGIELEDLSIQLNKPIDLTQTGKLREQGFALASKYVDQAEAALQ